MIRDNAVLEIKLLSMKKLLLLIGIVFSLTACNNPVKQEVIESPQDGIELIYFHGAQQCATCKAIEKLSQEVVEQEFAEEVKKGNLRFRIVDITDSQNTPLADKYEVSWSSLFLVKHFGDEEKYENLTEFAFANARKNPDLFKEELASRIREF